MWGRNNGAENEHRVGTESCSKGCALIWTREWNHVVFAKKNDESCSEEFRLFYDALPLALAEAEAADPP